MPSEDRTLAAKGNNWVVFGALRRPGYHFFYQSIRRNKRNKLKAFHKNLEVHLGLKLVS